MILSIMYDINTVLKHSKLQGLQHAFGIQLLWFILNDLGLVTEHYGIYFVDLKVGIACCF